jgi:hypothetical protein
MLESKSQKNIPFEQAEEEAIKAIKRIGMLFAAFAETAVDELGEDEGKAFVAKAIKMYGTWIGLVVRDRVKRKRLKPTLGNYNEHLPLLGFDFELISEKPYMFRINNCPLAGIWRELDIDPELASLYCLVDQVKYSAYNSNISCVHKSHTLRDGTPYCDFLLEEKITDQK